MTKIQFSVLMAMGLIGVAVLVVLRDDSGTHARLEGSEASGQELARITSEVSALRESIGEVAEAISDLQSLQQNLADRMTAVPLTASSDGEGSVAPALSKADLKDYVAAVLTQEREVRDEEREQQREEFRKRQEEREQELAAMREGPYDKHNLRVNSMGKVLGMNDGQKQAYYELSLAYSTKMEEGMKALREKREAEREAGGGGEDGESRRGRRGGGGDEFRKLYSDAQEQFSGEMQQILSEEQFATFSELSRDARSFSGNGMVSSGGDSRRGGFSTRTFGGDTGRGGRGGGGRGR